MKIFNSEKLIRQLLTPLMTLIFATSVQSNAYANDDDIFTVGDLQYRVLSETEKTAQTYGPIDADNRGGTLSSTTINIPATVTNSSNPSNSTTYKVVGNSTLSTWNNSKVRVVNINSADFNINTSLDNNFLMGCQYLEKITVINSNHYLTVYNEILYNNDKTVLIKAPATTTSVSIPSSVHTVYYAAFRFANLQGSLSIPSTVTKIGVQAFSYNPELTSVTVPAGVEVLPFGVFEQCTKLSSLTLNEGLKTISSSAVNACAITTISLPQTVETANLDGASQLNKIYAYNNKAVSCPAFAAPQNVTLYVPTGTKALYQAEGKLGYKASSIVELDNAITINGSNTIEQGTTQTISLKGPSDISSYSSFEFEVELPATMTLDKVSSTTNAKFSFSKTQPDALKSYKYKVTATASSTSNVWASFIDLTITASKNATEGNNYVYFNNVKFGNSKLNNSAATIVVNKSIPPIESITLSQTTAELSIGDKLKLTPTISPQESSQLPINWSSSNPSVASVDLNGNVSAIAAGSATITVSSAADSSIKASCSIKVNKPDLLTYEYDSTTMTAKVTGVKEGETPTEIYIPEAVIYEGKSYRVTTIGEKAFYNSKIKGNLTLPTSLTTIEGYAFNNCSGLTGNLTIPNSVTTIGDYSFTSCSGFTGSLNIPNSVTTIGDAAFRGCTGLTSVTIPTSVTSIGGYAFYECESLISVTIPNSVTLIEPYTFYRCTSLSSVDIPTSVTSIGEYAFFCCTGLTSVTIPNSVTSIGESAFYSCTGLTSVTIPTSVTEIGGGAFGGCTGLTSVTIPNSVTSIGERAFGGCTGLTSVTIPTSVTSIGRYAFSHCTSLSSVDIPNSVTSIGDYAFSECECLISVTIPNSVTLIEPYTFYRCTSLSSVDIPTSVTEIGRGAFDNCTGLTSVTIPTSVTEIGGGAFYSCTGLTSVTIPNSVTWLGGSVFYGCTGLTEVYSCIKDISEVSIDSSVFNNANTNATLYVPKSSIDQYKSTSPWSKFTNIIGRQLVEDIEIASDVKIFTCKKNQLTAKVMPEDADDKNLTWSSCNTNVLTVDNNGNITTKNVGSAVITVKANDKSGISKTINVTVTEPALGDSNASGDINIADATNTANRAIGNTVTEFYEKYADVNGDNRITISDASATVSLVLAQPAKRAPAHIRALNDDGAKPAVDHLVIDDFSARAGRNTNVAVALDNSVDYVALQADVFVPDGLTLESITAGDRAAGHAVSYREVEPGIFRAALFDLGLHEFAADGASLFNLNFAVSDENAGDIIIDNIIASDASANEYYLASIGGHNNGLTGIDSAVTDNVTISTENGAIRVNGAEGNRVTITTTDGRTIASTTAASDSETYTVTAGLYIVSAAKKVAKVIVK